MALSKIDSASLNSPITADDLGVTGNLALTGTAQRITGDFSNATLANRVMFQTSTANTGTSVGAAPSGTNDSSAYNLFTSSDPTNSSFGQFRVGTGTGDVRITSGITGTGAYLPMTFHTGGSERVRVDTSGNVGIGTSSPTQPLQIYRDGANASISLTTATTGATSSDGFSIVSETGSGDAFLIQRENANMIFRTNNAERARIDSSGNLLVGTTSNFSAKFSVLWASSTQSGITLRPTSETYNGSPILFQNSSGGVSGFIGQGTSTVSYNTSSDYRLKEAIAPMTGALAKVALLKPCTYKWKVDGSDGQGFIAHELDEVVPGCVTGEKDAVDAEGKPQYQGIDTSFLVATLTAAIQELKAIVDAQGAEIAALKGTS